MSRTKLLAILGLLLTLSSLFLGSRFLGYRLAVFLGQVGGLAFVSGMFLRITGTHGTEPDKCRRGPLDGLYDLEPGDLPESTIG